MLARLNTLLKAPGECAADEAVVQYSFRAWSRSGSMENWSSIAWTFGVITTAIVICSGDLFTSDGNCVVWAKVSWSSHIDTPWRTNIIDVTQRTRTKIKWNREREKKIWMMMTAVCHTIANSIRALNLMQKAWQIMRWINGRILNSVSTARSLRYYATGAFNCHGNCVRKHCVSKCASSQFFSTWESTKKTAENSNCKLIRKYIPLIH